MRKWIFCLLILSTNYACATVEEIKPTLINQVRINVREPSALSFSADRKSLWTVSDSNGSLYSLDFNGNILKEIKTKSSDLEGIVNHPDLNGYCLVEERVRNVVCLDSNGKTVSKNAVAISGASNSGLEGITFNPENQRFYLVNEKEPTLILELDRDFNLLSKTAISFAKDLSDIFYDENEKKLWVLSHESQMAYKLDQNYQVEMTINLRGVVQAEGLVIDSINKKAYVVSDKDSLFLTYKY